MRSPAASGGQPGTARTPWPGEGGIPRGSVLTHFQGRSTAAAWVPFARTASPKPQAPHPAPPAAVQVQGPRPYLKASAEEGGGFIPPQPGPPGLRTQPPPGAAPPPADPGPGAGLYFLQSPERQEGRGPNRVVTPPEKHDKSAQANSLAPPTTGCERRWAWLRASWVS